MPGFCGWHKLEKDPGRENAHLPSEGERMSEQKRVESFACLLCLRGWHLNEEGRGAILSHSPSSAQPLGLLIPRDVRKLEIDFSRIGRNCWEGREYEDGR